MPRRPTNLILPLLLTIGLWGCDQQPKASAASEEYQPMQPIHYTCALEQDHNPPLDPEADKYFQQARTLEKVNGWEDWPKIVDLYQKAIEQKHWKAMNNLAIHYQKGQYGPDDKMDHPTGIKKDPVKALALYAKMVELKVPMGYYNWAIAIGRGQVPNTPRHDAGLFMLKAAELGYPLAQVALGNHYAFGLPQGEQRDDVAEQYFKCAGKQDNVKALLEVASFYKIAKKNNPLAAYYYQKATSLGSTRGAMNLESAFEERDTSNFGYKPDKELEQLYNKLYDELDKKPELKLPNLIKDHPLPRHPTQGYDADNPDIRPQE